MIFPLTTFSSELVDNYPRLLSIQLANLDELFDFGLPSEPGVVEDNVKEVLEFLPALLDELWILVGGCPEVCFGELG